MAYLMKDTELKVLILEQRTELAPAEQQAAPKATDLSPTYLESLSASSPSAL
jgi:hypothetical protein